MYYLTTENALDLIELDIIEEKADTGSSKLATHMKTYYKYYLVAAGLVTAITAAIVIAKKNGDKEGTKKLEEALKKIKKIKQEAEKTIKENKKTVENIGKMTPEEIERTKEKVRKNTEDIKERINKVKSEVPNYIDKSKFTYNDIAGIGYGKNTDEAMNAFNKSDDKALRKKIKETHEKMNDPYSYRYRKKMLKKGVKAIDEIEKGKKPTFANMAYDRTLVKRDEFPKTHN